jgi:uncharacterized protein
MHHGILMVNGEDRGFSVSRCSNFVERARGLLGRPTLAPSEALWIAPCASVHTLGMRYSIDVIFCDFEGTVLRIVENLESGRIAVAIGARAACEVRSGVVRRIGIAVRDRLTFGRMEAG